MALSARQERFCAEFAKCGNAAEAYKRAGYKAASSEAAAANGGRLMKKAEIKQRLQELTEEVRREDIATIAEIQSRLTAIMRGEEPEEVVVVEGIGDGCSEARKVHKKPNVKDMIKAGETLAKMQGAFDRGAQLAVIVPVIGGDEHLED